MPDPFPRADDRPILLPAAEEREAPAGFWPGFLRQSGWLPPHPPVALRPTA